MSWIPSDPAPVIMERVELAPGHRLGQVPCTRNIYFDPNKLPPEVPRDILPEMVPETLLYFDEEARFIYYNMGGTKRLPFGLRNYLATTKIDLLSPTRTRTEELRVGKEGG